MTDELLPFYDRELAYIRQLGAEFGRTHPKIAGRLRLEEGTSEDPHVERLIEAFAYLSARTRMKLEDDFPEIGDSLLNVLYPHYLRPIPSASIVQFQLDRSQVDLVNGFRVARHTPLESEPIQGFPCRFRTCYPVDLWPFDLVSATLRGAPFNAPITPHSAQAAAVLCLKFRTFSATTSWATIELPSLRFFVRGQPQIAYPLHDLICHQAIDVAIATSADDRAPIRLKPRSHIRPVGFGEEEGLLSYPDQSFLGYRLLTEFFAFPAKFLFFELADIPRAALARAGETLEVYIYLSHTSGTLEQNVTAENLPLGCTPIINLYRQRAEPIELTHGQPEYRVVPDARRPIGHEVYSIDEISAVSSDDEEVAISPFFSMGHARQDGDRRVFWTATRRHAERPDELVDDGTEMYVSVVDLDFDTHTTGDLTLDVRTTCLNRDVPQRLPFGGGQPRFHLAEGSGPLGQINCLTAPTRVLRPSLGQGNRWRLISHLSLGHLSLSDGEAGAAALREILNLYDFHDSAESRAIIGSIRNVRSRRIVGHVPGRVGGGICRGLEVAITFDEDHFSGSSLLLFGSVLERFLALYASINSFTQLVALSQRRSVDVKRWPPRSGDSLIL